MHVWLGANREALPCIVVCHLGFFKISSIHRVCKNEVDIFPSKEGDEDTGKKL